MPRINGHKVEHFETPADNVDSLKEFYYSLFGWQFTKGQTQAYGDDFKEFCRSSYISIGCGSFS